jgi:hypothetical protein
MQEHLDAIEEHIKNGNQTEAILTMVQYIKHKHKKLEGVNDLVRVCNGLEAIHEFYGRLPRGLWQVREDICNHCFGFLTKEEINLFLKAFNK